MAVRKTMPGTSTQPARDPNYPGNRMGQPNEQAKEAFNPPATTTVPQFPLSFANLLCFLKKYLIT